MQQAGIAGTESFLCLASVSDALHVQSTSQMDAWRRLDLAAGRVSALWRSRKELTTLANLRMKRVLERLLPWVAFEKKTQDGSTKIMKGGEFVEEARGEPTVNPGIELGHLSWSDTEREYQLRYNPLSPKMNKLQIGYLAQLIKLCDDEGIHLIVVNMPLSRRNKSSMPLDFYTTFKNQVSQLCRRSNHADFVDLASSRFDADENFADGVHLRCDRSQPFIDFLAQELTKTRLSEMLGSSANSGLYQAERRLPAE